MALSTLHGSELEAPPPPEPKARDQARLSFEKVERADVARMVLQQTVDHRGIE